MHTNVSVFQRNSNAQLIPPFPIYVVKLSSCSGFHRASCENVKAVKTPHSSHGSFSSHVEFVCNSVVSNRPYRIS